MQLLQVLQLGTVDYATALKLQNTLVELRKQNRIADTLLLLEHPPVITLGRNAQERNIIASPELLAQRGVEIFETNRGGDVTFHGPGQLVGYPICDLRGFSPRVGAVEFVRRIEEVLIRACAEFGIGTKRVCGLTGVWTGIDSGPAECGANDSSASPERSENRAQRSAEHGEKKIAAIGVHISRGITSHGFALNVTTDLERFNLIVPCGISDKPVTSMEQELADKTPTMEAVCNAVTRQFGNVFGVQILWLESLESLLRSSAESDENHNEEHSGPPNQDTPLREPDDLKRLREEFENAPNDDIHWA